VLQSRFSASFSCQLNSLPLSKVKVLTQCLSGVSRVGGALYKYLRHQHKKYRKRYGKNDYQGRIPNRIDINEHPSIVVSCQLNSLPLSKVKVLTQCLSGVSSLLIASFAFLDLGNAWGIRPHLRSLLR
jgi:hypothetical protein